MLKSHAETLRGQASAVLCPSGSRRRLEALALEPELWHKRPGGGCLSLAFWAQPCRVDEQLLVTTGRGSGVCFFFSSPKKRVRDGGGNFQLCVGLI